MRLPRVRNGEQFLRYIVERPYIRLVAESPTGYVVSGYYRVEPDPASPDTDIRLTSLDNGQSWSKSISGFRYSTDAAVYGPPGDTVSLEYPSVDMLESCMRRDPAVVSPRALLDTLQTMLAMFRDHFESWAFDGEYDKGPNVGMQIAYLCLAALPPPGKERGPGFDFHDNDRSDSRRDVLNALRANYPTYHPIWRLLDGDEPWAGKAP